MPDLKSQFDACVKRGYKLFYDPLVNRIKKKMKTVKD